jgi:acetyltransferase
MGREGLPQGRAELHAAGIPAYIFPESAARALFALNRQREWQERPVAEVVRRPANRDAAQRILGDAARAGRAQLTQRESLALLEAYGVTTAPVLLITDQSELEKSAEAIGYPLVMKLESPDITHKTEVGGVRVGIANASQLREAYLAMLSSVRRAAPQARVEGVFLQRLVSGGRETIVGISRDSRFGALLMFGLGGIFVETLQDVIFRLPPVDEMQARDMVRGIRGARVLRAHRGALAVDEPALVNTICRVGQLADDFPEIAELDINPLLALPEGAIAVDARVRIEADARSHDKSGPTV